MARPRTSVAAAALVVATGLTGTACGQTKQQKEGGELYARMCAVCHGPKGEGYKADQAPDKK